MGKRILFILIDGFEEIEAITPIDILRRLDFKVIIASANTEKKVIGAHDIKIEADCLLNQTTAEYYDAVILPGGMPGSKNLKVNELVCDIFNKIYKNGGVVGAICAAPIVLYKAGILAGKNVTSYPTVKDTFENAIYTGNSIEVDGRIITAKGAGYSSQFAAKISKALGVDPINTLGKMYIS